MVAKAYIKYLRISPKKLRQVVSIIKGKFAPEALSILKVINKKGAQLLTKVLTSALANAKNKGYKEDKLYISKLLINPGPVLKRWRAASFGRATMIRKKTSHIIVELNSSEKILEGIKAKKVKK